MLPYGLGPFRLWRPTRSRLNLYKDCWRCKFAHDPSRNILYRRNSPGGDPSSRAFFAVGAYTAAILIDQANWPFWATLPMAALTCFIAGYLFGLPALRLEGHYLALATFALAVAVPQILKYRHLEPFTKGVQGMNIFKADPPFGLPLSSDQWMFLVVLAVAILMFWAARNLLDGRIGRALRAIRDQPLAADTMGINSSHY